MNDAPLTDEEVRNTFYSLKTNKSPGYDNISFNAINNIFDFILRSDNVTNHAFLTWMFSYAIIEDN